MSESAEENKNQHWIENEETAKQRIDQALELKKVAAKGGLRFEVYLPPGLAEWVLEMVEKGDFIDPCEAVFVYMQQAQEIASHDDLLEEVFKRTIQEGIDDIENGRCYSLEEVKEKFKKSLADRTEPVVWKKIKQPEG